MKKKKNKKSKFWCILGNSLLYAVIVITSIIVYDKVRFGEAEEPVAEETAPTIEEATDHTIDELDLKKLDLKALVTKEPEPLRMRYSLCPAGSTVFKMNHETGEVYFFSGGMFLPIQTISHAQIYGIIPQLEKELKEKQEALKPKAE